MPTYFSVSTDNALSLAKIPTAIKALYKNDQDYAKLLGTRSKEVGRLQTLLYAERSRAVLLVLQGMDTSGKDGAIKHVMADINPQGCQVVSFKTPTSTELEHDFLWRSHCLMPARGMIGIFNRSYYEEVLITYIHSQLLELQNLPDAVQDEDFWHHRYKDIVNHEKYLHRQGYEIIKIFIHISKDEQKARLLARFEDPEKHWKISVSDVKERRHWKEYQRAYENCIRHTSSKSCPWYVVPGDDKKNARIMISEIVAERMARLGLAYPPLDDALKGKLAEMKKELAGSK